MSAVSNRNGEHNQDIQTWLQCVHSSRPFLCHFYSDSVVFDRVVVVIFIKPHTDKVFSVVGMTTLKTATKKIVVRRRKFEREFLVVFIQMSLRICFILLDLVCATCVLAEKVEREREMRKVQIAVAATNFIHFFHIDN